MSKKDIKKKNGMGRLMKLIWKEYKAAVIVVALAIVGSALASVQGSLFLQSLIDDYIIPLTRSTEKDYSPLAAALLRMAGIYGIGIICSYLYNRIMVNVSQGTMKKVRTSLFNHMQTLPISYFDTHSHGDTMSIYTNDTDTLRQFISQSLPQLLNSMITVVSVFVAMITLNVPLTVAAVCMVLVMLIVSQKFGRKSGTYFMEQQRSIGKLNGYVEEMVTGQKVVKVFNYEDRNLEEFRRVNQELRDASTNANVYANILLPVIMQLGNLSYVICAILGAVLALNGYAGVTIGVLVSFLTLNKNFTQPFGQISQQINSVVMAMAGVDRIYSLLDEESESDEGDVNLVNVRYNEAGEIEETTERTGHWAWKQSSENDKSAEYQSLTGEVVFENVDFGYNDEKIVLHDINLYAEKGQKIAFVGSTGAGKTTITNLINRFYDIQKGNIRYDGINIEKINKKDLRRSLSMVLQDTHLFTGTIMDNIRYGRLDATEEECIAAAKLANADDFIRMLPDGYHTVITGDGDSLSQGQRQLLSIARAAVADAPALILDEATSSIDTHTEALVQSGMDKLMEGRTTFVIAHRLSTIRNADCIMVLENGRIIERGSHEQLMAKNGRYCQLYTGNALAS